jgi:hypothetical protein
MEYAEGVLKQMHAFTRQLRSVWFLSFLLAILLIVRTERFRNPVLWDKATNYQWTDIANINNEQRKVEREGTDIEKTPPSRKKYDQVTENQSASRKHYSENRLLADLSQETEVLL